MSTASNTIPPLFVTSTIAVDQPIGTFFIAAIPARVLLEVSFSDKLRAVKSGETYNVDGAQRELLEPRLREIGRYISSYDAAIPNSIVLAANYEEVTGSIEEDESLRWSVRRKADGEGQPAETAHGNTDCMELIIPTSKRLAAVVDGQHRLFGFTHASPRRLDTQLLCAIFLDLPKPFQAYLFATINSTQKPVDRSQTYELFGYNIDEEPENEWSPEKLAVFIARKLNTEDESPFRKRILVAAENDFMLSRSAARAQSHWMISMATVVDGILRLISSSPRSDAYALRGRRGLTRDHLSRSGRQDRSPLRRLYLETNDKLIHAAVLNFFKAADELFFSKADAANSFIIKTVGIQALFDVLRAMVGEALEKTNFSTSYFIEALKPAAPIDFADDAFRSPSGSGRTFIRQLIVYAVTGEHDDIGDDRKAEFDRLLGRS